MKGSCGISELSSGYFGDFTHVCNSYTWLTSSRFPATNSCGGFLKVRFQAYEQIISGTNAGSFMFEILF